jgi:phospholipase C
MKRIAGLLLVVAMSLASIGPSSMSQPHAHAAASTPRWYQHIFVIMLENHSSTILATGHAPRLTALGREFGVATHYYAITHPSEPNYIALLGGSTFGINGDAAYTYTDKYGVHYTVTLHSLITQLEAAGLSWKSYQQSMPYAGYTGLTFPNSKRPLYVARHNPFLNFSYVQNSQTELRKLVPVSQLGVDLQHGQIPTFGFIAPDLCHDMHGQYPACDSAHATGDARDVRLISQADAYVSGLVQAITRASFWSHGNNAIVITWDEDDSAVTSTAKGQKATVMGCCDALPGGGHIATIVITSHGPHGKVDPTPYNHYSLLRTIQVAFGLGCLQRTCDTKNVKIMRQLFTVAR